MNCCSCFGSQKSRKSRSKKEHGSVRNESSKKQKAGANSKKGQVTNQVDNENINAKTFTFRELATATKNFRQECLLGKGGFGKVFKGTLASNGQVVAVKQLDRNGMQGNKEFLVEVLMLSLLNHPNLVNLVGYCADGDQRLLVYEFMSGGSLEDHFLDAENKKAALDWQTRMKIAFGAAKGLEYLHDKANPPVIYRDLKPSDILLDGDLTPKLSDFGLAKLSSSGDSMHISSRVMGTYGYCAPEYARGGQLTLKSDVYSFGVVFLELITGRRALDTTRPMEEQNLVAWAQPIFRDPKRFPDMADPLLNSKFPEKDLNQAVAIAAMCLQEEPAARPLISDVVTALSFLSLSKSEIAVSPLPPSSPAEVEPVISHSQQTDSEDNSDDEDRVSGSPQNEDKQKDVNTHLLKDSLSSSYRSSKVMQDASDSSSDDSGSSSHRQEALLRHKSSKISSRKGSTNSQKDKSMSRRSSGVSRNDAEYWSYRSVSRNGSNSSEDSSTKGSNDGSSDNDHNDD